MSLIEEALQRVNEPLISAEERAKASLGPQQSVAAPRDPIGALPMLQPPSTSSIGSVAPSSAPTVIAVIVLVLTAALILASAVWMGRLMRVTSPAAPPLPAAQSVPSAPATAARHAKPATPVSSAPLAIPQEAYVLTGIVEGVGTPYAVINGAVVAVGDFIGKARLLEILHGAVKLRLSDGNELILRVPR